jgi:hypothetical protein
LFELGHNARVEIKPNRSGGEVRQAYVVPIFSAIAVFVACIVLASLPPNRAEAQDNICSETTTVLDIDSTTADRTESFRTTQQSFLVIYDVDFTDDQNSDNSFDLEIRDGSRVVESNTSTEDGPSSFRVLEQPGSFTIETDVEPDRAAEYEVLIEECADEDGGGGNGGGDDGDGDRDDNGDGGTPGNDQYDNDDGGGDDGDGDRDDEDVVIAGDVDDPDDVILDPVLEDKKLVNTGGIPLVAVAGLLLACATGLFVRVLRR